MEKIRFFSKDRNEKEFAVEVKKRVHSFFVQNKISIQGNTKLYLKSAVMLSIYLVPFILILIIPMHPLTALGMAVLMGIGEAGVGMSIMHDGAHGSYSSKKWLNKLAASTMFLLGSNTFNWKVQHNVKHHTFTNIYHYDSDISTKAVIRLCENAPLKKYHRYQHIYAFPLYGLMTFARLFGEINTLLELGKERLIGGHKVNLGVELSKLITTKIVYFAVILGLPLLLTDFAFWQILTGFLVMHIVAGMIMSTVFQMAHVVEGAYQPLPDKNNIIPTEWHVHQLRATADFGRRNGLLSWYIGGLDHQIEHHLFQNISHVHYHSIAPIVEQTAKEYGLSYNRKPTFLHALASHYRRLRSLGDSNNIPADRFF